MPSIAELLEQSKVVSRGVAVALDTEQSIPLLAKRVDIPIDSTSSLRQIEETQQDPWSKSGKYALGWVYFSIILLALSATIRYYHLWGDKIRTALHKEESLKSAQIMSPESEYELPSAMTDSSTKQFFPATGRLPSTEQPDRQHYISSLAPINNTIACMRWIFYRPIPVLKIWKFEFVFPSLGVTFIVSVAMVFVTLYCFVPQPFFYSTWRYGSPPLAIRAGMIAVAMMPWVIALSMKANLVSMLTGIGHERLNVLHRWGGYLMMFLSLVHTVPFYIVPNSDEGGYTLWKQFFDQGYYIYGSGLAALVPLLFLCVHSLPFLRHWMYELFVILHVPVSIVFLGTMFWHCRDFLTSWNYLFATLGIWVSSYLIRLLYLNWTNPRRMSWLIGEESAITILPENAIKVTIPTQMRWKPGQYVYLRMPGISIFESHPFTISSLCSDDFPSEYGEQYRDMALVFRPFGGFTKKVLHTAIEKGPYKTYRAFLDGPYGGMQREMTSFDHVVFFAGGSGITAIASQLLHLIKRMRDGKAVTKTIRLVWALKRPETLEWFKEELRICREFAPPGSFYCQFFVTASERVIPDLEPEARSRPHSGQFHDKINDMFQGVASKRSSTYIKEEAGGDKDREMELRRENEDAITALPQGFLAPPRQAHLKNNPPRLINTQVQSPDSNKSFDFGFPTTPTTFQKSLMRFAFLPTPKKDGHSVSYGRPEIPYMLKDMSREFGRRTCVFVCGPPSMRVDVANSVAALQSEVWHDSNKNEIFLHAENYAI